MRAKNKVALAVELSICLNQVANSPPGLFSNEDATVCKDIARFVTVCFFP